MDVRTGDPAWNPPDDTLTAAEQAQRIIAEHQHERSCPGAYKATPCGFCDLIGHLAVTALRRHPRVLAGLAAQAAQCSCPAYSAVLGVPLPVSESCPIHGLRAGGQ